MTSSSDAQADVAIRPDDRGLSGLSRRRFVQALGLTGVAGSIPLSTLRAAAAEAGVAMDEWTLVPEDKEIPAEWLRTLTSRGTERVLSGDDLTWVGLPIGGITAGQVYLAGDGRLWKWDVDNRISSYNDNGIHYSQPWKVASPFGTGVALRTTVGGTVDSRWLDGRGFSKVRFRGRYPQGRVELSSPAAAVRAELTAYSPFVPLDADRSSHPVTVLEYTLTNVANMTAEVELGVFAENPTALDTRKVRDVRLTAAATTGTGLAGVQFAVRADEPSGPGEPDIVFEDWEKETYQGWAVEGTAFGSGPILVTDIPSYQGNVNAVGLRCVNSHASAPGTSIDEKDAATGRLTSAPFTVQRRYLRFRIGGGPHQGQTALQVVVDGQVVAEANGQSSNQMTEQVLRLSPWLGKQAQIVILDTYSGGWANIGVDQLVFTDNPGAVGDIAKASDYGTFTIGVESGPGLRTHIRPSISRWSTPAEVLDSGPAPGQVTGDVPQAGVCGTKMTLQPRESRTVRLYYGWHYANTSSLTFLSTPTRRWYTSAYPDAASAVAAVHADIDQLSAGTRDWTKAWFEESTLPWWLLERTATGLSTLATSTCYRLEDGRFYGWEGAYCCAGTCQHVWQYAHAVARVFPELERDTRERVDLGIGRNATTGEIGNRAEADRGWAADGQAGTILRIYREHQMRPDGAWLRMVWPRVRKSIEWMIQHDIQPDGVLDGAQHNTLDAAWYGRISWLSGLYVASLRAGQAMATIVGDGAFATRCAVLADSGSTMIERDLYNGSWFVHEVDPAHPGTVNTNRGVHIDQVLGQSWAHQVGLPRVFAKDKAVSALESLWRYNFTPRPVEYRENSPIEGGRTYYDADTHALLMCTWPIGGADEAGQNWSLGYFNEAMNGFEYQVAAHMVSEGLVEKGLLVTRAVHERYQPKRRNPYNEIECGDHYARSMASYGVYLSVLGFECDGPAGHLGFAPVIQQDDFAAVFTAAGGWGRYVQRRGASGQTSTLDIRSGQVRVATMRLDVPGTGTTVKIKHGSRTVAATARRDSAGRLVVRLTSPVTVGAGEKLIVEAR